MSNHHDTANNALPTQSVMYSQLQPWSQAGAPPCMEPVGGPAVPTRLAASYETTQRHPWRPKMAFEMIEIKHMPEQPVTNQMTQPCFVPQGMKTEGMIFPNLVTGFERNPQHAARAALYTRYTNNEWHSNNLGIYGESNTNRNLSERMRNDAVRLMRETDETATAGQRDAGRRLGERITDLTFWRNELNAELEKLIGEMSDINELQRQCGKAMLDLEVPLHIAQECLFHREARQGMEKVHDNVEKALLLEINHLRNSRDRLKELHEKIAKQAIDCRGAQHLLEIDVTQKESTMGIDSMCHRLNNYSRGITYFGGIEKYDPTVSSQDSWALASSEHVKRSQAERAKLSQLRSDSQNVVNAVASSVWDFWNNTNNALDRRSQEMAGAKNRVQLHLQKVQQELFDMEKHLFLLQKAIQDKSNPLKVAQTRLEARSHREGMELCKDTAHDRLVQEVQDIQGTVDVLHHKLQEAEATHQSLLKTRCILEEDLRNKVNALFIDREKCMSLRRSFPISNLIRY
ncbi:tektin-3 [Drosophila sulfurigaster albostrigata]|uniref:Tektin n=1 Tax=Drosophila albomicans TaxID=7291 RepID=A0A6P8ZGA9_DROAB|nr:tektin-3 [Drosophila albomicans]XP_062139495.1 tektin-3 [Drosophila sulfurigaster albostrigata]